MKLFKSKIQDIVVFVIFVGLLILGTKLDFKISDKMYTEKNWLNFFVAAIAKLPFYFVAMYACVNLFISALRKQNKAEKYIMAFVYCLGALVCGMFAFEDMIEVFIDGIFKYLIAMAVGALVSGYLYYVFRNKAEEEIIRYKKEFLTIIIAAAIIVVITFALKSFIDRARFYEFLNRHGSFTPWYKKGTGGDSMPSGHVAIAAALFATIPLFKKMDLFKGKDYLYYPVIALYALLVGLSRIAFGMHYMSDVAIGGIVGYCVSKVVTWILFGFAEENTEIKEGSLLSKL